MLLNLRDVMRLSSMISSSQVPGNARTFPNSNSDTRGGTGTTFTASFGSASHGLEMMDDLKTPWAASPMSMERMEQAHLDAMAPVYYDSSSSAQWPMSTSAMVAGPSFSRGGEVSPQSAELTSSWPLNARISPTSPTTHTRYPPSPASANPNAGLGVLDSDYRDPYAYGADDPDSEEEYYRPQEYELTERRTLPYNNTPTTIHFAEEYYGHQSAPARRFDEEELAGGYHQAPRGGGLFSRPPNEGLRTPVESRNPYFDPTSPHPPPPRRPPDPNDHDTDSGSILIIE